MRSVELAFLVALVCGCATTETARIRVELDAFVNAFLRVEPGCPLTAVDLPSDWAARAFIRTEVAGFGGGPLPVIECRYGQLFTIWPAIELQQQLGGDQTCVLVVLDSTKSIADLRRAFGPNGDKDTRLLEYDISRPGLPVLQRYVKTTAGENTQGAADGTPGSGGLGVKPSESQ